jgi:hypothetical protein
VAEARNAGHLIDVWEGNSGNPANPIGENKANPIWYSYDNGPPRQLGNGNVTMASPAVSPIGNNGAFMVFHTGTDGEINFSTVFGDNSALGWAQIPGQSTPNDFAVSAVPIGEGSNQVLVAYRSSNDNRVWESFYSDGQWSNPKNIGSGAGVGEAVAPPAICLDSASSSIWAVAIGTDNQVWTNNQSLGAPSWPNWTPQGAFAARPNLSGAPSDPSTFDNRIQAPSCAVTNSGNVVLSYIDGNAHPNYKVLDSGGGLVSDWMQDSTGWQTANTVTLSANGNTVSALFTGLPGALNSSQSTTRTASNTASVTSGWFFWKQLYSQ